jgi:hypothetical protein
MLQEEHRDGWTFLTLAMVGPGPWSLDGWRGHQE